MEETCIKLNSTQKIVVKWLQQLVTECTDLVLATQPTGYRAYRPGTDYIALLTLPHPAGYRVYLPNQVHSTVLVLGQADSKHLQDMASTDRLQSLPTGCRLHSPYCTVLHPNWLQMLPTGYREKTTKKTKKKLANIDQ